MSDAVKEAPATPGRRGGERGALKKGLLRSDLGTVLRARVRTIANSLTGIRHESGLKIAFITIFAMAFWVALLAGFPHPVWRLPEAVLPRA